VNGGGAPDRFQRLLAADERARAERFAFNHLRRAFVLTRCVLRVLLGGYLGIAPEAVRFIYGAQGKPDVEAKTRVRFNVSHSGELAIFAFTTDCEIGVDVEVVRPLPDLEEIAARFFSREESSELFAVAPADRNLAFFLCWTRKEAFIKAIGHGLSTPLDSFAVTLRPGEAARMTRLADAMGKVREWTMHHLEPAPGYVAALAYRDSPRPVQTTAIEDVSMLLELQ
jgi:4'-phosphopantetheinyl transferase